MVEDKQKGIECFFRGHRYVGVRSVRGRNRHYQLVCTNCRHVERKVSD